MITKKELEAITDKGIICDAICRAFNSIDFGKEIGKRQATKKGIKNRKGK